MKIAIILGTRPEIIKMSPIVRELEKRNIAYFILHTGQHYSYNMDRIFFEQLRLPEPKYNLEVGSGSHAEQTGKMMIGIEQVLMKEEPDIVLVQGDTNTVLAGALAAVKLMIKIGHVEAGLRSFNREMPEEINRLLTDHISDYLFAPTKNAKQNLLNEGIDQHKIYVTGNTIVDAINQNLQLAKNSKILDLLNLNRREYFLLTLHRQENVDKEYRLKKIIKGVTLLAREFDIPIIYPIHPRSRKRLEQFNIKIDKKIKLIEPLDYFSFLNLESNAKLILTDSGGVQEEACILKVPCVTLRYSTERPETIKVGANILAGSEPSSILEKVKIMLKKPRNWPNPFGDGTASIKIINILSSSIN